MGNFEKFFELNYFFSNGGGILKEKIIDKEKLLSFCETIYHD